MMRKPARKWRHLPWTANAEKFIRTHFGRRTVAQIATALGRPVGSVRVRARKLGLRGFYQWTAKEDKLLVSLYPRHTAIWIAKQLNRKPPAIYWRVKVLGLRKNRRRD